MPLQVDVEALVEAGAVPENNDDGKSPLFIAAERGKGNVLRYHSSLIFIFIVRSVTTLHR